MRKSAKWYPREVYSPREDVTHENMRAYDALQERIYARCLVIAPNYRELSFREQLAVKEQARIEVK